MHFLAALFLFAMSECVCVCSCFANPYPCLSTPSPVLGVVLFCVQPFVVLVVAHMKMKNCLTAGQTGQITQSTHPTPNTHTQTHTYLHTYCQWQLVARALRRHTRGKGKQCQGGVGRGSNVRLSRLWLRFYVITLRLRDV